MAHKAMHYSDAPADRWPHIKPRPVLSENLDIVVGCSDKSTGGIFCRYLERFRFTALHTSSGPEAFDLMSRHTCRLLVADLELPGVNGAELARLAKTLWPHMPVIIMTGQGTAAVEDSGVLPYADAVLYKPFDLDLLVQEIENLLTRLRSPRADRFADPIASNAPIKLWKLPAPGSA